jgi:hypothetical protein
MVETGRKESGMIPISQWLAQQPEPQVWHEPHEGGGGTARDDASPPGGEASLIEAFARGRAEAEAEFKLQLEAADAAARQHCKTLLEQERQRWLQDEICRMVEKIDGVIESIWLRLSNDIALVLKQFVTKAVRKKALAEFKQMVETHLRCDEGCMVRLKAPRDILDVFGVSLLHMGLRCEFLEADNCDLTLEAGATSFETQTAKWLAAIGVESHG